MSINSINNTNDKPLLVFHANFKKISGPLVTGETQVIFDVPELFENEIEGIVRLLKQKNLIIKIYDSDFLDNNFGSNNTFSNNNTFSDYNNYVATSSTSHSEDQADTEEII